MGQLRVSESTIAQALDRLEQAVGRRANKKTTAGGTLRGGRDGTKFQDAVRRVGTTDIRGSGYLRYERAPRDSVYLDVTWIGETLSPRYSVVCGRETVDETFASRGEAIARTLGLLDRSR